MLLTMEEMDFVSKTTYTDENGKTMAKADLSEEEKERLAGIDEYHFLTKGVHFIENFGEVGATEEPSLFYKQMTCSQAQLAMFRELKKCQTEDERNQILREYFAISSEILRRELTLADEGWLVD